MECFLIVLSSSDNDWLQIIILMKFKWRVILDILHRSPIATVNDRLWYCQRDICPATVHCKYCASISSKISIWSSIYDGSTSKFTGLKGPADNVFVPHTTADLNRSQLQRGSTQYQSCGFNIMEFLSTFLSFHHFCASFLMSIATYNYEKYRSVLLSVLG